MANESPAAVLVDDNSNFLSIQDDTSIPANTPGLFAMGETADAKSKRLRVESDGTLSVATQPPSPPPGTTEFVLAQDEVDLSIDGAASPATKDSAIIGDGVNVYIQSFSAGAAGDPNEKGSKVEILWVEGSPEVEHIVERLYVGGASVSLELPNINKARDGTLLTGNGSNTKVRLRRVRFSNSAQEVDGEIRGYIV
jgi:hypothetical protein